MATQGYQSATDRLYGLGINLGPVDALPPNRVPFLQNVREYRPGRIQSRAGTSAIATVTAPCTTIARLNDSVAATNIRLYGLTNGALSRQSSAGGAVTVTDTGYSGNPLVILDETPPLSPEPWAYVADSTRIRKIKSDGTVRSWGIAQATIPPAVTLAQPALRVIQACNNNADWTAAGTGGAAANAAPVATTVAAIVYDSGNTGYCDIVPTAFTNIIDGIRLTLNAAETVIVDQILIAIASTTIAQIVFDVGTTGLCTIQPTASLGVGQTVSPPIVQYQQAAQNTAVSPPATGNQAAPPVPDATSQPVSRQVDFPVNCLVRINSGGGTDETVRILSVQVGTDGVQSFRCSTANTHAAGETLTGRAAFRCYTTTTIANGNAIASTSISQSLTPTIPSGATQVDMVGGLFNATAVTGATVASATLTRAVLPDDIVHLSIKVDQMQAVSGVRLYLNLDAGGFLTNYYFFEWRANDLISAIQATNAGPVDTVSQARLDVVTNAQIDPSIQAQLQGSGRTAQITRLLGLTNPNSVYNVPATTDPGDLAAINSTSLQLALGSNQWISLRCRVADLVRVGRDTTKTLDNITGSQVLFSATSTATVANPLAVEIAAIYIQGGFGPNAGDVGNPYNLVAVGRDASLGVVSNGSPPSRGGVFARRQRVLCTPPADMPASPTVSIIDWFAIGGLLDRYTYVGSSPNDGSVFNYDAADANVVGGQTLVVDNFQPWPTNDLPRSGTCVVAGSAIQRIAGDNFNLAWAQGTAIVVNGFTVIIDQVLSTSRMLLRGNAGAAATATWSIANPTLLGQPLPAVWGDLGGIYFACGDPNNPGTVQWCKPNTLDMVSDRNNALVTGGGEPLQHGYIYDVESYVASTNHIYRLTPNGLGGFTPLRTAGNRGFWTRWAFTVQLEGVYFLAEDGIYIKVGGGIEVSITDADLYPLFPHDGIPGVTVNGIAPPDMAQTTRLRLSKVDRYLYFDYADTAGHDRTLVFDTVLKAWTSWDDYGAGAGVLTRFEEPGSGVHDQLLAHADTTIRQYTGVNDLGRAIAAGLDTRAVDGGAARVLKQFGDAMVKANVDGAAGGITATVVYNDNQSVVSASVIGAGASGLNLYPVDVDSGRGVLARNLGLQLRWSDSTSSPGVELWEASYLPKADSALLRATDWDDLGYAGAKFIQGVVIRANTFGATKSINIEADGVGDVALSLSVTHDGEQEKAYPLSGAWTPFVAQLVRLIATDTAAWQLYGVRWVFEPAPEAATQWQTQFTTHDLPGYFTVRDSVMAYSADDDVTLTIQYDDLSSVTYILPGTSGIYKRTYIPFRAGKGRSVQYTLTSAEPFRVYQRDCSVRVQSWGGGQGYGIYNPFGGPSRMAGAEI